MVDDRALQLLPFAGEVDHAVGRVTDHIGRRRALETHLVDRLLEQRIEGRGDKEIEIGDLRELSQCARGCEARVTKDAAHARIDFLTTAARGEERAHDVVQRVRRRKRGGVDVEPGSQLFGDPVVEQAGPGFGLDLQKLGADDRDDPALIDEVEQVFPGLVVERGRGRPHG